MKLKKSLLLIVLAISVVMWSGCSKNESEEASVVSSSETEQKIEYGVTMYDLAGNTEVFDVSEVESQKALGMMELHEFVLDKSFEEIYNYYGNLNFAYGYDGGYFFADPQDGAVHFGFGVYEFCKENGELMDVYEMENHKGTPMPADPKGAKCYSIYGPMSRVLPGMEALTDDGGIITKSALSKCFGDAVEFNFVKMENYIACVLLESPYFPNGLNCFIYTDNQWNVKFDEAVVEIGSVISDDYIDTPESTQSAPAHADTTGYKSAYKEILLGALGSVYDPEYASFDLIYINNDDIPELVYNTGNSHADGAFLYTYHGGKAVAVTCGGGSDPSSNVYGSWGGLKYLERSGKFASAYSGMGVTVIKVYGLENAGAVLLCDFEDSTSTLGGGKRTINSQETDYDTYVNTLRSYGFTDEYGDGGYTQSPSSISEISGYKMYEAVINDVLS